MGDPVGKGCGHFGIAEDTDLFGEAEVGGDETGYFFVDLTNQMKKQYATRGRGREIVEFVDDDGVDLAEQFGQTSSASLSLFAFQQVDQINRAATSLANAQIRPSGNGNRDCWRCPTVFGNSGDKS